MKTILICLALGSIISLATGCASLMSGNDPRSAGSLSYSAPPPAPQWND